MAFGYLMAFKGVHRTSRGYQGHVHYIMQYKLFNFSAGSYLVFWHLPGQLTTTRPRASLSIMCGLYSEHFPHNFHEVPCEIKSLSWNPGLLFT
jgi:hypothetical protein